MASAVDLYMLERKAGNNAKKLMRSGLRYAVARTTHSRSGEASKSDSRAVYKDKRLQRITMKAPHYIFKQHFGFEGKKKNGVTMRLQSTGVLNIALDHSNVLNVLATDIANIRADDAVLRINFERRENAQYTTR